MGKKCMIADARNKAGMPCDGSGVPLRCYTNQSESVNNKLARQKEAIVKNNKNKVHLTKLQFMRDVWEEVHKHQQEELEMAISSQEFELMDMVRQLERPADEWFEMTRQQRKCYASKFNQMSVEDAVANMETPDAEFLEFKEFSVDLEKSLESLNVSVELISTIVKEAKKLLNIKNAIQKMPHEEKWMYPDPTKPNRKLPSAKYTVKFYCVKHSCIKERFPYYDSSLMQIPIDVKGRLCESHKNLLAEELFGE